MSPLEQLVYFVSQHHVECGGLIALFSLGMKLFYRCNACGDSGDSLFELQNSKRRTK